MAPWNFCGILHEDGEKSKNQLKIIINDSKIIKEIRIKSQDDAAASPLFELSLMLNFYVILLRKPQEFNNLTKNLCSKDLRRTLRSYSPFIERQSFPEPFKGAFNLRQRRKFMPNTGQTNL